MSVLKKKRKAAKHPREKMMQCTDCAPEGNMSGGTSATQSQWQESSKSCPFWPSVLPTHRELSVNT